MAKKLETTCNSLGDIESIISKVTKVIDDMRIEKGKWKGKEDTILYNGMPIGGTISEDSRLELNRWFGSFKSHLKADIKKQLRENIKI